MLRLTSMAKHKFTGPPPRNYGITLTVVMVVFSWVGMQLVFVGAGFFYKKLLEEALTMGGGALVLLGYSLHLKLRLKRSEAIPTREQAQLFYLGMLVALPALTFVEYYYIFHRWLMVGVAVWAGSAVITGLYGLMFVAVLRTEALYYPRGAKNAWSRRLIRMLRLPERWTEGG